MSQVLEILTSLGIDTTVFYQFFIFFVAYISMNHIVFKPYLKAHDERLRRTVGGEEQAKNLQEDTVKLEEQYSLEAKKLNDEIKTIFGEQNQKALKQKTEILEKARKDAEAKVQAGRSALDEAVSDARQAIGQQIPDISEKIENKFMGSGK